MNEQIKLLVEQARAESSQWLGSKPGITITYDELEKFAELIVLECADWLSHREFASPEALKHHFGLKQ